MGFLGIGSWEILLIIVLALIVLGPAKLTGFARTLGKTVRAIRKASTDLTSAVTRELDKAQEEPTKEEKQSQPSPDASEQGPEVEKTGPTDRERHP